MALRLSVNPGGRCALLPLGRPLHNTARRPLRALLPPAGRPLYLYGLLLVR
jgi:hypothetical protein